jgi:hypothetical protein
MDDAAAAHHRRVTLPWRVLFALYAIALTTGTHWPQLQLHVGEMPAPDKIIHMLGFGGLALLLWRTRWIRNAWLLLAVALIWTLLDELTQAIPIFGRTFSWLDIIGGWLGVTLVMAWVWALAPIGGVLNRKRLCVSEFVIDELFLRPRTWIIMGSASAGAAALVGGAAAFLTFRVHPDGTLSAFFAFGVIGGMSGAVATIIPLWRQERVRITSLRPCLACGEPHDDADVDEDGFGRCLRCGERVHIWQWASLELPRETVLRCGRRAVVTAILFGVAVALVHGAACVVASEHIAAPAASANGWGAPADLRLAAAVTLLGAIVAVGVRTFRSQVSWYVDRLGMPDEMSES